MLLNLTAEHVGNLGGSVLRKNADLRTCNGVVVENLIASLRLDMNIFTAFVNVDGKRVAQASESRTPPTLRTSMSVYLNNVII
jgi:hypothetical protein